MTARPRLSAWPHWLLLAGLALLAGCQSTPPKPPAPEPGPPPPVPVAQLPGISADDLSGLDQAIARQCQLARPPGHWPALCAEFAQLPPASLREWLERRFEARELLDQSQPEGLLTGYYEPLLTGSRLRESPRQVPLRALPTDLLTIDLSAIVPQLKGLRLRGRLDGQRVVPYADRRQIEDKERQYGTGEQQPVIAWADDPVDAFFLEIQGSGRLQLRDGSLIRIGYADQNGHPYHAIGKTLVRRGALKREEVTAPAIQSWLRQNPVEGRKVMQTNPGVVFFRELPTDPADPQAGPLGAMGVPLTPDRSIAVDRRHIPLGSPVFIQSTHPVSQQPIARMMLAQDTGGAIRGGRRADYFWGFGSQAGLAAGLMKAPVRMWILQPRF